jgi:ribosomal protein S15P/S13E
MVKEKQEKSKEKEKESDVSKEKPKTQEKKEVKEKTQKKPTAKDIEKKVLELAEKGLTSEKIGLELKKDFGKLEKKQISKILKKNNLFVDPDLKNLNNNLEILKKHMSNNKMDFAAKKAVEKKIAQLRKFKKIQEKKVSS